MFAEFNWVEAMQGSPILLALVACSIVTVAVAIERVWYFQKRHANADVVLAKAAERIRSGRLSEAMQICQNATHPLGDVAYRMLTSLVEGSGSSEEKLQVALSEQKLVLERNLSVLGSMAAIAPLVGLLGTVWGIMRAFHDMAQTGSAAPSVVAAGVAEALLTTAAGLVVAVPAVILYNHLTRRMTVMLTVAENNARSLRVTYLDSRDQNGDPNAKPDDLMREIQRSSGVDSTLLESVS